MGILCQSRHLRYMYIPKISQNRQSRAYRLPILAYWDIEGCASYNDLKESLHPLPDNDAPPWGCECTPLKRESEFVSINEPFSTISFRESGNRWFRVSAYTLAQLAGYFSPLCIPFISSTSSCLLLTPSLS